MIRHFIATAAMFAACTLFSSSPVAAQAKGSADAMAAKRTNPHWKTPRNAWGQPDLEGIWTTDDMRGVPMSRPQQYGTNVYLTDEQFAQRAKQRGTARDVDNARTGTFRNEEGSRDFSYTSMVIEPADGLPFIGKPTTDQEIYVATGFSGNGMTFGTLAAMLTASLRSLASIRK